ncbi:MAG TPA: ABC-2 family transporter protein [Anaerolineales bacterium]|nr:ABC-2 family transporter protein [Anaerolineales bacterium]
MEALRLYFKLVRISMQARLQYRADFIMGIFNVIALNAVNLGSISVLVYRFVHLKGWVIWELVFLYCLWLLGHSIYSLFFWHFWELEEYLVQGTFDQFFLRPASLFVQFLGREVQYIGFADVFVAVAGLSLAYSNLGLQWDVPMWFFFFLVVLSGTVIETTLVLMMACLSFWTGRSSMGIELIMHFNMLVQFYPIDIFGLWFRVVVTGLIPVAFMNYYPALILLGKANQEVPWWLGYLSPIVALLLTGITAFVWHLALRRYSSAGG